MRAIINVVKSIASGIQTAVEAVIWFITSIFDLIDMAVSALADAIKIITGIIPTPIFAVCIGVVTIAAIYKIMGRE